MIQTGVDVATVNPGCFDLLFSSIVLHLLSLDLLNVQFTFEMVETCVTELSVQKFHCAVFRRE